MARTWTERFGQILCVSCLFGRHKLIVHCSIGMASMLSGPLLKCVRRAYLFFITRRGTQKVITATVGDAPMTIAAITNASAVASGSRLALSLILLAKRFVNHLVTARVATVERELRRLGQTSASLDTADLLPFKL